MFIPTEPTAVPMCKSSDRSVSLSECVDRLSEFFCRARRAERPTPGRGMGCWKYISFTLPPLLLGAVLVSCRDGTALTSCQRVLDAYCSRFVACNAEGTVAQCLDLASASDPVVRCGEARQIRGEDDLKQCLQLIDASPCDQLHMLPAVCRQLVRY